MNKLQIKYWFNKFLIIFIIFCSNLIKVNAQNTFFIKIPAPGGAFQPNVFEDEKGCIIAQFGFGLTRITANGRILWSTKPINSIKSVCIRDSQYYFYSAMATEMGGFAVKAIDYKGKIKWIKYEEINQYTRLRTIWDFIIDSSRHQYIVAGERGYVSGKSNYYWIAGLDYSGNIIWEHEWGDSGESRTYTKILKNKKTGGYMLLTRDVHNHDKKELFSVDSMGRLLTRNTLVPEICSPDNPNKYVLDNSEFCEFENGFLASLYILSSSNCKQLEWGVYFFIFDYNGKITDIIPLTEENSLSYFEPLNNGDILGYYSILDTISDKYLIGIKVLDKNLEPKFRKIIPDLIKENEMITDMKITKSRDGGYIGIASGENTANENFVYVFKTDSLGNINPKEEYTEKMQPVMLQPNPATNNVRIAIPYYFGKVKTEFYNIHGVLLFYKTQDESEMFDISTLAPGIYIVKAILEETKENRTMRLIVK